MNITITGTITEIKDSVIRGSFESRNFWVKELEGQYPNTYSLEAHQQFCSELDKHSIGDIVECHVDVRGRQWSKDGKEGCMNTLRCWSIVSKQAVQKQSPKSDIVMDEQPLPF